MSNHTLARISAERLVVEQLAEDLLAAEARIADLKAERDVLRELLQAALDQLHQHTVQTRRFELRIAQLLDALNRRGEELRTLRAEHLATVA